MKYLFALGLLFSVTAYSKSPKPLAPYIQCYNSLSPKAGEQSLKLASNVVIIRGDRLGSQGLYAFSGTRVFYQPFPSSHRYFEPNKIKTYAYQLAFSGTQPIFFEYQETDEGKVALKQMRPQGTEYSKYLPFSHTPIVAMDPQFRNSLMNDLIQRVRKTKAMLAKGADQKNGEVVRLGYYQRLSTCRKSLPKYDEDNLALKHELKRTLLAIQKVGSKARSMKATMGLVPLPPTNTKK